MELCTIASGSKGNVSFLRSETTSILVDCGISAKRIVNALEGLTDTAKLDGIFITHEHRDHIAGLKTIAKKYQIPIFATTATIDEIRKISGFQDMDVSCFHPIQSRDRFIVGDLQITSFPIPHDAADPVGFTFENNGKKVAICTDIGRSTDCIIEHLSGSFAMVLEANHDVRLLQAGRYPYHLKKRILGDTGHLSNESSGKLLCEIWNENLKHIFLGHLSEENNMPELALESVKCELLEREKEFGTFTSIRVASQVLPSELVCI